MLKCANLVALLLCVALACAEPRMGPQQLALQRQLRADAAVASPNHPYIFLTAPRANGNGHDVQGFKVVETEDDDDDDATKNKINFANIANDYDDNDDEANDDDDDDENFEQNDDAEDNYASDDVDNDDDGADDEQFDDDDDDADDANDVTNNLVYVRSRAPHTPRVRNQGKQQVIAVSPDTKRTNPLNAQLVLKNAKPTNMMVSREHAGTIMVPDGFIEIEGQTIVDEKTGKTSLLVPRAALDAIPDGSVVALMDSNANDSDEARANRVLVRRRKGSRRNVVRRRGGKVRRRRGGKRRRRGGNRRKNVRVYKSGGNRRRQGNRRGRRPAVLQG